MAASATSLPAESPDIAEYDEDTDTEVDPGTSDHFDDGMVIKLEPQSDTEDSYQTSWSSSRVPESSQVYNSSVYNHVSPPHSTGDSTVTADCNYSMQVKQESSSDCKMAVFPVRMYRNEHNGAGSRELPLPGLGPTGEQSEDRECVQDVADPGHCAGTSRPSGVSRRKRLAVKRAPSDASVGRKRRKKKAPSEGMDVAGAVKDHSASQPDAAAVDLGTLENMVHPVTGDVLPEHLRPVFRPGKRGRRRANKGQNLLVCGECGMTFCWQSRYNEHIRKHTGERPFICRECGDAFTSSSYLRIHSRKHSGQLPYPCVFCDAAFSQARFLTEHRRTHAEEGAFTCEECGLKCNSPGELSKHLLKVHPSNPSNKPFVCHLCPAAFMRTYHLETHMRTHTGEKPFKCALCGLAYTTQAALKVHNRTHTGERPYTCPECGRGFITSGQLKKHVRTHNRPVVTVSQDSSTVFVQRVKAVKTEDSVGQSVQLEIQCFPKDSTYTCELCQDVFVRSIDLASHMRHDHPQPTSKDKMCRECGQVFTRAHTLKVHLRSHTGLRPFKCEICGKQFTQRGNLNTHLRSHSSHKAFKCSVCGVSYSTAKYREVHMKSHVEIRPSACVVCGSTFSSNALLTIHLRSHDHAQVTAAYSASATFKESLEAASTQAMKVSNGQSDDGKSDCGQEVCVQGKEASSEEVCGNPNMHLDQDSTDDESAAPQRDRVSPDRNNT